MIRKRVVELDAFFFESASTGIYIPQFTKVILILSGFFMISLCGNSQSRDSFDLLLNGEDKATVEDIIVTSQAISSESQEKLQEALVNWEKLEAEFANLPPALQNKINEINAQGLKNKINGFLKSFEQFDSGLDGLLAKKEKLDEAINFYDRYRFDTQNPFRSLEVMKNFFTDVEHLLPKEKKYEFFTNTTVWLIRTGLRYAREAISQAHDGLKNVQKQIKDRAGNCIGYVGGDATADSSDPKRKAFTDLNTGDIICYSGIRPVGGEVWNNTNGDDVLVWSSGKWTKLNCNLGDAENVFMYWKIANGKVITADNYIFLCNNRLGEFKKAKARGEMLFNKLSAINTCDDYLLSVAEKKRTLVELMDLINEDQKTFTAKYISKKDDVRTDAELLNGIISNSVLFEGVIQDNSGQLVSGASISIETGTDKVFEISDTNGFFKIKTEIPEKNQETIPIKIHVTASNYVDLEILTKLQSQCMDLGILKLNEKNRKDELIITPPNSKILTGETVNFRVFLQDVNGNNTDVTSIALTDPTFYGTSIGSFNITATYGNLSAVAMVDVVQNDCKENEVWNDLIQDCICINGYVKDDLGNCVEQKDIEEEITACPDPNSEKIWDENSKKYICNCVENYTIDPSSGLCVLDINKLLSQSECANVQGATADWDEAAQQVVCKCTNNYYYWDSGQKKCMPDIQAILNNSDCSQYPNTKAIWDYNLNEPVCDCLPGYAWNKENTGCVSVQKQQIENADCSGYLNTRPIWDDNSKQVVCDCLPGYKWNKENTVCLEEWKEALQEADCSGYLNTRAVWDPENKEVYCDCLPGYKWSADNTHCEKEAVEQVQSNLCWQYPNTEPVFDPGSGQYVCDCIPGYRWNSQGTGCVPEQKKPDVNFADVLSTVTSIINATNPNGFVNTGYTGYSDGVIGGVTDVGMGTQAPVTHQSNCNDKQQSGGDDPEVHTIDLGQSVGTFLFDYDTFDVKDQIIVSTGGRVIFNSGCVGQKKSIRLNLSGFSSVVTVRVNPNCGGTKSTGWNFTVHCPD